MAAAIQSIRGLGRRLRAGTALVPATLIGTAAFWISILSTAGIAAAQVLEINGGSSSLYQTQGGSIILHGPAYETELGGGVIAGKFVAGGRLAYKDRSTTYSAGVEEVRFDLPTDLFNTDHRLLGIGIGLKSVTATRTVELFAGGTSQRFDTPLFSGVRADQPAAAFVLRKSITTRVVYTSQVLAANPSTVLQAVEWKPRVWLALAAAGGAGGRSRYEAFSVNLQRPRYDLKAAYVDEGANFQRVGAEPTISTEAVHENLQFTVRSSAHNPRVTFSGGRQNFMVPADSAAATTTATGFATVNPAAGSTAQSQSPISTSNQFSVATGIKKVGLTGTVINSSYNGDSNLALVLSAAATPIRRIRLQSSFFQNRPLKTTIPVQVGTGSSNHLVTSTFVTNANEILTRRFAANQTFTYSNGQSSISYGGSILTKRVTITADYETFYVPTRPLNPFQQSLVLNVELNFFGRVTLKGGSFVSPTGKLLYSADLHAIDSRSPIQQAPAEHARFGAYVLQGRVIDNTGSPIYGAAIALGPNLLFTDSDGAFFLREMKAHTYTFKLLVDEFLDGHNYRVISQPQQVTGTKNEDQHLLIVVARVNGPAKSSANCDANAGPQKKQGATPDASTAKPCPATPAQPPQRVHKDGSP
jgi:hypothetical protein